MAWTTPETAVAGQVLTAAYLNTNVRDNLNVIGGLGSAWTSWTPVLRTGGSAVTLGSGSSAVGRYLRIGTLVIAEFYILFGSSGVSVPAGAMDLQALPIAAAGQSEANVVIGNAYARDATGSTVIGIVTAARNFASDGAGNYVWNNTTPFTWAANDDLRVSLMYQCGPAA